MAELEFEALFNDIMNRTRERRKALKELLDRVFDEDPTRTSEVLADMTRVNEKANAIDAHRPAFMQLMQAMRAVQGAREEVLSYVEKLMEDIRRFQSLKEEMANNQLEKLTQLFREDLGNRDFKFQFHLLDEQELHHLSELRSIARRNDSAPVPPSQRLSEPPPPQRYEPPPAQQPRWAESPPPPPQPQRYAEPPPMARYNPEPPPPQAHTPPPAYAPPPSYAPPPAYAPQQAYAPPPAAVAPPQAYAPPPSYQPEQPQYARPVSPEPQYAPPGYPSESHHASSQPTPAADLAWSEARVPDAPPAAQSDSEAWMQRPLATPTGPKTLSGPAPDPVLAQDHDAGFNTAEAAEDDGGYEVDVDVLRILSEETFRPAKK